MVLFISFIDGDSIKLKIIFLLITSWRVLNTSIYTKIYKAVQHDLSYFKLKMVLTYYYMQNKFINKPQTPRKRCPTCKYTYRKDYKVSNKCCDRENFFLSLRNKYDLFYLFYLI